VNLIDLHARKDKTLSVNGDISVTRWTERGESWRVLDLPNSHEAVLQLTNFIDTHPVWSRPDTFGWYAVGRDGEAQLSISFVRGATELSSSTIAVTRTPAPVYIPWPSPRHVLDAKTRLVIRVAGGTARAVGLMVHRVMTRQYLYDMAKGTGVEVGPGPKPQIHPSKDTEILYIEETRPEKWAQLYDKKGQFEADTADWSAIRVGKAGALPVEDGSLDFIFSSHVFEHLANPLGHLEHWHSKLKPDGVVLAVVPELTSTKDRYMRPCSIEEILGEYDTGIFEPEARHYDRYVTRLTRGVPDAARSRILRERAESIHVHFYDRYNIAQLLQIAVERLDYRNFQLRHTQNHKDFHFILCK
jgi:predicted SAM-dependent methyltransferase